MSVFVIFKSLLVLCCFVWNLEGFCFKHFCKIIFPANAIDDIIYYWNYLINYNSEFKYQETTRLELKQIEYNFVGLFFFCLFVLLLILSSPSLSLLLSFYLSYFNFKIHKPKRSIYSVSRSESTKKPKH